MNTNASWNHHLSFSPMAGSLLFCSRSETFESDNSQTGFKSFSKIKIKIIIMFHSEFCFELKGGNSSYPISCFAFDCRNPRSNLHHDR